MFGTDLRSILTTAEKKIAVITDNEERYFYGDLIEFAEKISSYLHKRSLVLNFCENTIGALVGYLAFTFNGHVSLMVNSSQNTEVANKLIDEYEPDYLWVKSSQASFFKESEIILSFADYSLISMQKKSPKYLHENLALLLPTSGSTGSPKYVKLSKQNILSNAQSIATFLKLDENQRPITSLPMYYSFGLSVINSHLISGSTILLTNLSILQKDFWSFLIKAKATSISGTPYHFEMLDRLKLDNLNKTNISTMTHAGGRMNTSLLKKLALFCDQNNLKFFSMYGQTEATARMSFVPPDKLLAKIGSIGIPIPGGSFELIDEAGSIIQSNNKSGELVYTGENVSLGYAKKRKDLLVGDQNFCRLYTGDIAKRDSDEFYYIVGRKSRFIKIYGNRINLDDIEQITNSEYGTCACVGRDDLLIIFSSIKNDKNEIRRFISKKTGINHRAIDIRLVDKIPRTVSGKISYSDLEIN